MAKVLRKGQRKWVGIKGLVAVFSEHEVKAEEDFQESLRNFIENNPGERLPGHMKEHFNICTALKLICKEIVAIKEKVGME